MQGDSIEREDANQSESVLVGITLTEGETGTDSYCLIPKNGNEHATSIGVYTIRWKR